MDDREAGLRNRVDMRLAGRDTKTHPKEFVITTPKWPGTAQGPQLPAPLKITRRMRTLGGRGLQHPKGSLQKPGDAFTQRPHSVLLL